MLTWGVGVGKLGICSPHSSPGTCNALGNWREALTSML